MGIFFMELFFWTNHENIIFSDPQTKYWVSTVDFSSGVFHNNKMAIYRTGSKLKCL
jgi:hypothetical protein